MFKRLLVIFLFSVLLIPDISASHYMGGEITWQCLPNGRFRFILKLYRECNGISYSSVDNLDVANCPGLTSIQMNLVPGANPYDGLDGLLDGKTDISPNCWNNSQEIHCSPNPSVPNTGAVQEWFFTSDAAYPNGVLLNGVPPPVGWIFSHTSCCRNPSTNMVNPTGSDWFLRAIMYPYQGQNTFPCYDNSPVFAEIPSTVICTGYPFTYNHNATDKELDSLSFEWAPALQSLVVPMGYTAGYSFNSPLPGPAQNPLNVAATMNAYNGEISYTSYTNGAFVTVTKVSAFRCGIKIAEIFREMQIVLLACPGSNLPPEVSAPFYNPITGLYDLYVDTVYAGDVVDFDITALDFDMLPNGNPVTITLEASGQDFGTGFSDPNSGCLRPPCATLNPPPIISAMVAVATHFHWQTTCDHLTMAYPTGSGTTIGCATLFNVHTFVLKIYDNFCPAPGITIATISVVVLPKPVLPPPDIRCVAVDPAGNVTLNWIPPDDSQNAFDSYHVYHSSGPGGPFTVIDSVFTWGQTSYIHVGAGGNSGPQYYYVATRSGCGGLWFNNPILGDTVSSIFLNVTATGNGQVADLNWNHINNPPPPTSMGPYRIYREYPAGVWTLAGSTYSTNYQDTIAVCSALINYRVERSDSSGCVSVSSIDGDMLHSVIEAPDVRCVSVDPAGNVTLTWIPPADTINAFNSYFIYNSTSALGPFTIIDSIFTWGQTSYTHTGANGNNAPQYYYMNTRYGCGTFWFAEPDDTLSSIYLDVTALGSGQLADLNWNHISNPPPLTSMGPYRIYREFPVGVWLLLDSTYSTNWVDTVTVCDAFINYRVEREDSSGCVSVSCIDGDQLHDGYPPSMPVLDSVSVDLLSGLTILGWTPSISPDTRKYYIYQIIGGPWQLIDSVFGINNTSYTNLNSSPGTGSESYCIQAVDSCEKLSPMGLEHKTIYLSLPVLDACANKIALNWNSYENMGPSLAGYRVFISTDGSPYSLAAVLGPTVLTWDHNGLIENATYCFYVQAFSDSNVVSSTSNYQCALATKPNQPDYVFLRYATVRNNDYADLCFFVDSSAYISAYKILRSEDGANYDTITVLYPSSNAANVYYSDHNINVNERSYYYKVVVVDSCNLNVLTSNKAHTIFLQGVVDEYLINKLLWNVYEDRYALYYDLYREVEDYSPFALHSSLMWNPNTFLDDVSNFTETGGRFRYFIEAILNDVYLGQHLFADTVMSNEVVVMQEPRLYVPTAFAPDGINNTFMPIAVFSDPSDYYFVIYNRWGEKMFETTDIYTGWDGRYMSAKCPFGIYTYFVRIKDSSGKYFEKRGIVTLIR